MDVTAHVSAMTFEKRRGQATDERFGVVLAAWLLLRFGKGVS
jgi:hypothetical protein